MNAGLDSNHSSIYYYDGDYPSQKLSVFPENFDQTTIFQGLRYDVPRYEEIASRVGGPILELCCGTGRVAIPLARQGLEVTGVDISPGLLARFRDNLLRENNAAPRNITLIEQDITHLSLEVKRYSLAILAFNSLLCILSFEDQLQVLERVAEHLTADGVL